MTTTRRKLQRCVLKPSHTDSSCLQQTVCWPLPATDGAQISSFLAAVCACLGASSLVMVVLAAGRCVTACRCSQMCRKLHQRSTFKGSAPTLPSPLRCLLGMLPALGNAAYRMRRLASLLTRVRVAFTMAAERRRHSVPPALAKGQPVEAQGVARAVRTGEQLAGLLDLERHHRDRDSDHCVRGRSDAA